VLHATGGYQNFNFKNNFNILKIFFYYLLNAFKIYNNFFIQFSASYLHGMYAFGLEECGQYPEAERHARLGLQLQPQATFRGNFRRKSEIYYFFLKILLT
jgi:hypothetical protein